MSEILIVDDDRDVAQTIKIALQRRGFGVQIAYTGLEALRMLNHYHPSLIILDVSMPGIDGLEVCRRVRNTPKIADMPIIFLTARGQDQDRIDGFRAGADDYLSKPFNLEELILRINAILRRVQAAPESKQTDTLRIGNLELNVKTFSVQVGGRTVQLTPTEFDLLYHLMAHAGQVFSSERLLREVWNFPQNAGNTDVVRAHVKNLREKIEPDPKHPIYVQTVQRHGYVIYENNDSEQ